MKHALFLALRYMLYYRVRTVVLVVCVSVAMFLPLAVHSLVGYYRRVMVGRSERTPLLIGAKGSAYDLVLNTLYFRGRLEQKLTMVQVRQVRQGALAEPVPMYVRFTAGQCPIVGTTLDYFAFRGLKLRRGTLPQVLGDVVLGAAAAERLGLTVGGRLLSDQEKLYDMSSNYPLLMRVVGVLAESGTADDRVVFADIRTAWIIEGIGHGHTEARRVTDPTLLTSVTEQNVVMSAAVTQYNEVTADNLDSFHFHGDERGYPVSAIIALPHDDKSATILNARYRLSPDAQAVVPRKVVAEMMDIVSRVMQFLNAIFLTVLASTALLLLLVIVLSLRIRRRELQTLFKIGCSRWAVFSVQAGEIALLLAVSIATAGVLLGGAMWYVVRFDVLL